MGNIIKITESDLKTLIRESVEQYLNEVDLDTAIAAGDKAAYLSRKKQAKTFKDYALKKVNDGAEGTILDITGNYITFKNIDNSATMTVTKEGMLKIGRTSECEIGQLNYLPESYRLDKSTARKVANWCNRYMLQGKSRENATDWHYWALL